MRADIAALQVALESADLAALRRAAHRIKGSALTIGAERLAALATRVVDAPAGVDAPQLSTRRTPNVTDQRRVQARCDAVRCIGRLGHFGDVVFVPQHSSGGFDDDSLDGRTVGVRTADCSDRRSGKVDNLIDGYAALFEEE